jgi:ubiquinone/menaquinone biosynthesis C-methylase UbiE
VKGSRQEVPGYVHGTAAEEQERLKVLNSLTNPAFVEFLDFAPGGRVLEVGSGLGILAQDVAGTTKPSLTVGVELSSEQLARAPRPSARLAFVQADAHRLPFASGTFEVVYTRYLLEHVHDPRAVLGEIRRVLVPGGGVYLQENNILINAFDPVCPAFDLVWKKFAELQRRLGGDAEIGKKLYRLLRESGFEDIRLTIAPEVHHAGMETYRPWVVNLLGNIRSGEQALIDRGFATRSQIDAAYAELERLMDDPGGSAFFYWNRAAARKPGGPDALVEWP